MNQSSKNIMEIEDNPIIKKKKTKKYMQEIGKKGGDKFAENIKIKQ